MISLSGHLGAKVSALVDGQLSASEQERAWSHVLTCPGCRAAVEREGWTKRQLGGLSAATQTTPPDVLGSLYAVDAWSRVREIERRSARRVATAVVVGGGALSAAVIGFIAVTGGPTGTVPRHPSPADISTPTRTPARTSAPTPSPTTGARSVPAATPTVASRARR